MRAIPIGNDIRVRWSIKDKVGNDYDLTGLDLTLYMTIQFWKVKVEDFTVDGNVVQFNFPGKEQKYTGTAILELFVNEDAADMSRVDTKDAFMLVEHSWEAGGEDDGNIEIEVVELTSQIEANGYYPEASVERQTGGVRITMKDSRGTTTAVVRDGVNGPRGEQGPAGPTGETGPQGPKGDKGDPGEKGDQGARGPEGAQGERGMRGPQGEQGERGEAGPQGPEGPAGPRGATGPQGEAGPQGPQGIQGPQGERGPRGYKGEQGPAGSTGPQGVKGDPGEGFKITRSFNSIAAMQAAEKTVGDFYIILTEDTTAEEYGYVYLYTQEGLQFIVDMSVAGAQGIQGPRGPQGIQGPQGERGPQGPQGEQGPRGATGQQGEQGIRGERGPQGIQGEQGPAGAKGADGDPGPTGPQGPAGVTSADVTVYDTTGTPSASATVRNGVLSLAFSGLKGEEGPAGTPGENAVGIEDVSTQQDGTVVITLTDGNAITIDLNHNHPAYYSKVAETNNPSGGFLPDVVYSLGTLTGSVTFALAAAVTGNVNHYFFMFSTGGTAPTITWPTGITWAVGSAPTVAANMKYEISILNGVAYYSEV